MRSFLILCLFIAYLLGADWYFFCQLRQQCATTTAVTGEDVPRLKNLSLYEKGQIIYSGYDQFHFPNNTVNPLLNENNLSFLDSVADFLQKNPEKSLEITSFYRPSEEDPNFSYSYFENIGLARAANVRTELRRRGVSEERIGLDHGISDTDSLTEPLDFELYPKGETAGRLQFSFTNMDFSDANFEFNSDVFKPTQAFKFYADSLKTYLEINQDKSLVITGHTDNKGTPSYNQNLGMRRAKNTRDYLVSSHGIDATIDIASEGEKSPLVPNNSEANRQKNRRVKIEIQ